MIDYTEVVIRPLSTNTPDAPGDEATQASHSYANGELGKFVD